MRRKFSENPKILKSKIELANLIRKNWKRKGGKEIHPSRSYWGVFEKGDLRLRICFQRYVRNIFKVNYVTIYNDKDKFLKALSVKEIKNLLEKEQHEKTVRI